MIVNREQDQIQGFLGDASNLQGGFADEVVLARNEEEVAELLATCSSSGRPVTVAGAGTGLSGGRIPMGGVVLATARMATIESIDTERRTATVQPGVLLKDLQQEVESLDLLYPPDPTERTCFIGGTIATNASGARTFKYGPTRSYVQALRVVLSSGERLHLRRGEQCAVGRRLELKTEEGRVVQLQLPEYTMPPIKHAAGYYSAPDMDALDLFIGCEGTLGVVTSVELKLIPLPERLFSGVVFFPDEDATMHFVDEARARSEASRRNPNQYADAPRLDARALEFFDRNALEFIRNQFPNIPKSALGGAVWFEQETDDAREESLLGEWYELMVKHNALSDESWFAVGLEDQRRLRDFRHAVPSAVYEYISEHGQTKLGTDMAVPNGKLGELLLYYREQFALHSLKHLTWGHIGNNHLHANMLADGPVEFQTARDVYSRFVDKALALGGTVSAEHGIGKMKKQYLTRMFGVEGIRQMREVKRALDPAGILGVGTMFDVE